MSRASAAVRFEDGTILYAIYCGTSCRLWPRLFPTIDAAWDAYEAAPTLDQWTSAFLPAETLPQDSGEPVTIYESYGGGTQWQGFATREYVTSERDRFEVEGAVDCDGDPEWVTWKRA